LNFDEERIVRIVVMSGPRESSGEEIDTTGTK
jgi:hypothetical protein